MRKTVSIALVGFYLLLTTVAVNHHNHPLSQGENDHCPAYILGLSVNADQTPDALATLPAALHFFGNLTPENDLAVSQLSFFYISQRAPPAL